MPTSSVPIFLSSARFTSRTSEGAFTQQLQPPLAIPDTATKVRTYVESASVPFSMPNLDASTARVVVRMPLSTTPVTDSGEITLTLPTGVYDLNGVSARLNEAVNEWLHTNGYPVLVGDWRSYDYGSDEVKTTAAQPNFCELLPNFHSNRCELTLIYDGSEIDFADTATSLDDLLGFTSKCHRSEQAQVVIAFGGYTLPAAFCTTPYQGSGNLWQNVDVVVPAGTYTAATLCLATNTAFVTAVQARALAQYDSPQVASATAGGPLIASISLEASAEVAGQYRADIEMTAFKEPALLPAGGSMFGEFDAVGDITMSEGQNTAFQNLMGTLAYTQAVGTDLHTLATMWSGAQSTAFTAENVALIDRVSEIGISAPGLSHGSYSSGGSSSGATLARFQVTGQTGGIMVYRPPTPLKIDSSHLIGAQVNQVSLALTDQHGTRINDLLGESYSVVLVLEYDEA